MNCCCSVWTGLHHALFLATFYYPSTVSTHTDSNSPSCLHLQLPSFPAFIRVKRPPNATDRERSPARSPARRDDRDRSRSRSRDRHGDRDRKDDGNDL